MESMGYGHWYNVIVEHIVWAVDLRTGTHRNRQDILLYNEAMGFAYLRPFFDLLSKYNTENHTAFREFYPDIVDFFNCIVVEMSEYYDLVVHVVNERGGNLPDANVTVLWVDRWVWPDGKEVGSRLTNGTGHAVFENLIDTNYTLRVVREGYKNQTVEIALTSDRLNTLALQSVGFYTTTLEIAAVCAGVIAIIAATIFIILRRRGIFGVSNSIWNPSSY